MFVPNITNVYWVSCTEKGYNNLLIFNSFPSVMNQKECIQIRGEFLNHDTNLLYIYNALTTTGATQELPTRVIYKVFIRNRTGVPFMTVCRDLHTFRDFTWEFMTEAGALPCGSTHWVARSCPVESFLGTKYGVTTHEDNFINLNTKLHQNKLEIQHKQERWDTTHNQRDKYRLW